jgi:hypothetical protein
MVTHFGHLAQPQTSLVFEVLFKKAALALSQGLTGSARCVASFKSAGGTARSQRKDAAKEKRQSFTLSGLWTKERWNSVQRRPNTRDDAAEQDASFQMTLWTRVR